MNLDELYKWKEGDDTAPLVSYVLSVLEKVKPYYHPPNHWTKEQEDSLKKLFDIVSCGYYDGKILNFFDGDIEFHFSKCDVTIVVELENYYITIGETYGYYGSDRQYNYVATYCEDESILGFEELTNIQYLNNINTLVNVRKKSGCIP